MGKVLRRLKKYHAGLSGYERTSVARAGNGKEAPLLELYLKRSVRTYCYAQLTGDAALLVVGNLHGGTVYIKRFGGAYGDAGRARDAFVFMPRYVLRERLDFDPDTGEVLESLIHGFLFAGYLNDQLARLLRRHNAAQYIYHEIEIFNQVIDNRLINQR
jgi:hypothetical protein